MVINRANIAKELLPGLNAVFGTQYKDVDNEHLPLYDVENSERAFEEEVLFTGMGTAPVKTEGSAITYDDMREAWTARYLHDTVAIGFAITEEAVEDNLYDTVAKMQAKLIGRAMGNTKQVKAASLFNNATSSSFPIGDGVAFGSTAHPTVAAGNQSNLGSTDLSETAIENALINISQTKDDRGILLAAQAVSLHIPPQLMFVAQRILASDLRAASADNDINAIKSMSLLPKGFFVNHRFTSTANWFLRTDIPNGTKMFVRVPLQTKMEGDFDTGNMRYKARERYSFGVSEWRQWYINT